MQQKIDLSNSTMSIIHTRLKIRILHSDPFHKLVLILMSQIISGSSMVLRSFKELIGAEPLEYPDSEDQVARHNNLR